MMPDFPIDIRIRLAELKFFFVASWLCQFSALLACSVLLRQPTGQSQEASKKIQFCQSYSYANRKVWYHQIWIPSNLDFIVPDLNCIYIFFLGIGSSNVVALDERNLKRAVNRYGTMPKGARIGAYLESLRQSGMTPEPVTEQGVESDAVVDR